MASRSNFGSAAFFAAIASTVTFIAVAAAGVTLGEGGSTSPASDIMWIPIFSVFVFMAAICHAFFVGLPIYALLPRRWQASLGVNLGASFLVGAIPMPLLVFLLAGGDAGRLEGDAAILFHLWLAAAAAALGGLGMAGGFVFWLYMRDHESAGLDGGEAGR